MVSSTEPTRKTTSTSAQPGERRPKNTSVHSRLKPSCAKNSSMAGPMRSLVRQTSQAAMPIMM